MTQGVDVSRFHWPSIIWFFFAGVGLIGLLSEQSLEDIIRVFGFLSMGYASIRLVPADLFTKNRILPLRLKPPKHVRKIDISLLITGIACLWVSLMIGWGTGA